MAKIKERARAKATATPGQADTFYEEPVRESAAQGPAGDSDTTSEDEGPSVLVDGELLFRLEADILADIDERYLYLEAQRALRAQHEAAQFVEETGFGELAINQAAGQTSSLVGIVEDGKLVRWPPGTVLSYCVLKPTFPREDWYEEVVENMWLAAVDWAETCGVEFEYVEAIDSSDSLRPPEVLFPVRHINAGGVFIASSFFPNTILSRRRMLVDPSYHTTTFDRVGVFRHELGHVMGFRHEQVRPEAPKICPDEDATGTLDLTAYDPRSVMHYFCGGVGSRQLAITELDRAGSQNLYGAPLSSFQLAKV
jgi:hypothetical protein